jgi:IS30 family transposase
MTQDRLNNRPIKVLNYQTAKEALLESFKVENIALVT